MYSINYKHNRYIERDLSDYSLYAIVDELRHDARSSWRVMHSFRRQAAETTDDLQRCDFERMALHCKQRLLIVLGVLNAGLDRHGSYQATYSRRLDRDITEWKTRKALAS